MWVIQIRIILFQVITTGKLRNLENSGIKRNNLNLEKVIWKFIMIWNNNIVNEEEDKIYT